MTAFAGLDVGTSGGRCAIVSAEGDLLASARRTWRPRIDEAGFPATDTDEVLRALRDAFDEASARAGVPIAAIGVTSQRSGVVFLDEQDAVLLASPNADGRAAMEGVALEKAHGDVVYRLAGRLPVMLYLPARLAWLRANRPQHAEQVVAALSFADWVVHALTGARATDPTQAAESLCYDVAAGAYSQDLLERLAVPRALLPPVLPSGTVAGTVRADGFPAGIPVACAGGDTQAALLGAGVVQPGARAVVAGTTMLCEQVADNAAPDPSGTLWSSPHAVEGRFLREAHCGEAGAAVRWLADLLAIDDEQVAALASAAEPGAGGVGFIDPLPSDATNFTLVRRGGLTFPVPLLALGRGRQDVARAVFEGIAFGACAGLDLLGEETGPVTVTGGVARCDVLAQTIAGVCDEAVLVPERPEVSSARGAAIAAAAHHHGGVARAAEAMADTGRRFDPADAGHYAALYARFREQADELRSSWMRIGDL